MLTPTSLINDVPIVFHNEDGTPYLPLNFRGEWKGTVLLYDALAQSMNVPSLKVLDTIGFDAAINRASALLGYTSADDIRRIFPRVYPLGLGIISTSPLRMAKAFATFANQGREVTPMAIRSVEDRNGKVVLDIERDIRLQQRRQGNDIQVISPQNAYIMVSMLKKTVEQGTLAGPSLNPADNWSYKFNFKDENGKNFRMPMAGKTGTPQNWSDAWTVGFSPYYTTAIWFGFDKPGNSLGVNLTGSTLAGPVWADFMREVHQGLPFKDFVRPTSGIIDVTVCVKSGLLKTAACNQGDVTLPFLEGTQPSLYCTVHGNTGSLEINLERLRTDTLTIDDADLLKSLTMPSLPAEYADRNSSRNSTSRTPPARTNSRTPGRSSTPENSNTANSSNQASEPEINYGLELPSYNPLLD
jgi:penicillin-binding protein 1A